MPGPSAVTAAVALSGEEASGFLFGGFLPARPAAARHAALERLLTAAGTVGLPLVVFEAPHRVRSLLRELVRVAPATSVALCRELTKMHEQVLSGTPAEVATALGEPRGEFTLVIGGILAADAAGAHFYAAPVVEAAHAAGIAPRTTVELLRAAGLSRRAAYQAVQAADR